MCTLIVFKMKYAFADDDHDDLQVCTKTSTFQVEREFCDVIWRRGVFTNFGVLNWCSGR